MPLSKFCALLVLTLSVCARSHNHTIESEIPVLASDSGIRGPKYAAILERLHRMAAVPQTELIHYGNSTLGKPLVLFRLGKKLARRSKPAILITGTTHGSEFLNLEIDLIEQFLKRSAQTGPVAKFLGRGGQILFAPVVNPDGYEKHSRGNARGVDLNRDWASAPMAGPGFSQPETRYLASQLERMVDLQYELTVDYHCCGGALLSSVAVGGVPTAAERQVEYLKISEMASQLLGLTPGTTPTIYGYSPQGTSREYFAMRFGALSFTLEGRWKEEQHNLNSHMTWWESVIAYLNDSGKRTTVADVRLSPPLLVSGE